MSQEVVYTLTIEITGLNVAEAVAGEKGAGEALEQLENEIKGMNFAAASTNVRTKSLVKVE